MRVLFDTNLWISFMIGKQLSSLADVLNSTEVKVYVCAPLLNEIRMVLERPKFDSLISEETRSSFFQMVDDVCYWTEISVRAESPIRDIKDLYLLSMAESVPVDYIVSGDKDLLVLKNHAGIPIICYNEFVERVLNN